MESINLIRLKTGEDIICYSEDYGHDEIYIRDPFVVFFKSDPRTSKQYLLMDYWLPSQIIENNETIIKVSDVMAKMIPTEEFIDYYQQTLETFKSKRLRKNIEDDIKLTDEEMHMILDLVGPDNQMH